MATSTTTLERRGQRGPSPNGSRPARPGPPRRRPTGPGGAVGREHDGRPRRPRHHPRQAPRRAATAALGPGELGLARAHVSRRARHRGRHRRRCSRPSARSAPRDQNLGFTGWARGAKAALSVGAVGRPCRPGRGGRRAVAATRRSATPRPSSHHYDVGNEFYEIVLGPAMTYSCAYFERAGRDLADAQAAKHELVCRKLGLPTNARRVAAAARRGLRVGLAGDARGRPPRRPGRRHHDQPGAGRPRPGSGSRRRARGPRRDPAAGLPRPRRRAVRRDLVDRHVRARRPGADGRLLRDAARRSSARRAGC